MGAFRAPNPHDQSRLAGLDKKIFVDPVACTKQALPFHAALLLAVYLCYTIRK
jgi:hypothetical protein